MEMKPKLAEYLMAHGVLKSADAQTMAQEIIDMLINNLIERNHELEQKELLRSASRPAEAEAMRNVLEESKRLREQLDAAEKACAAVRQYSQKVSAVGYKEGVVGSHVQMLLGEHGKRFWNDEQVRPLVQVIVNVLDNFTPDHLNHITCSLLGTRLQQVLAHARAVGMEGI